MLRSAAHDTNQAIRPPASGYTHTHTRTHLHIHTHTCRRGQNAVLCKSRARGSVARQPRRRAIPPMLLFTFCLCSVSGKTTVRGGAARGAVNPNPAPAAGVNGTATRGGTPRRRDAAPEWDLAPFRGTGHRAACCNCAAAALPWPAPVAALCTLCIARSAVVSLAPRSRD